MSVPDKDNPILVIGAAGRIGAVGRTVVEMLIADGHQVRAQVRTDDERAEALRNMGAEVVVGDLLDITAVHRAVEGCKRLCFTMSVAPTFLEVATNVVAVARHHGLTAFVNLSQMTVNELDVFTTTPSPQQKQHWLAEQILSWSGLPVVEVRPTAFMEGLFLQSAQTIARTDRIMAPFGTGRNSAIAAYDVARVIARILGDPAEHVGQIYHLTGPVSQDMDAVAREFSAALGRTITYVDASPDKLKEQLEAFGISQHVVSHVMTMAELHRANRYDRSSNDVEGITGAPPMSVRDFVTRHATLFSAGGQAVSVPAA